VCVGCEHLYLRRLADERYAGTELNYKRLAKYSSSDSGNDNEAAPMMIEEEQEQGGQQQRQQGIGEQLF
jgi:hypothetical protein